jgi:glutamate:Na+ symporter, ESS family
VQADHIAFSILILGILLLAGFGIRLKVKFFQRYFIPSSVIAGFLGMLLGPEILGVITGENQFFSAGIFPEEMLLVWRELPGLMITLIFATIFLGKKIEPIKKIWKIAGPQLAFGSTLAWGQYVVGISLVLLVLIPFFDVHPMMGAMIEISFEGGIGTTTGLTPTFEVMGFAEGREIGVGLATIGLLSGLFFGILILNWGVSSGKTSLLQSPEEASTQSRKGLQDKEKLPSAGNLTTKSAAIETLTVHMGIISASILVGYLILRILQFIETYTWGRWTGFVLMEHFPLFPLALIGSVVVQILLTKISSYPLIDQKLIRRINGFALDIMITSAIASLSLSVIGDHIIPFLVLAIAGIVWNLIGFFFIAKYMMPNYWFERAICDFGQSMGMTAIGLLLIRTADPKDKSPALSGFAYKQILFEPILGGGLFTAASGPLIVQWGLIPVLILSMVLTIGWFLLGYFYFGNKRGHN